MKIFMMGLFVILSRVAQAGPFEDKESCVLVYLKKNEIQYNLSMLCDGHTLLQRKVKRAIHMDETRTFTDLLYQSFLVLVDEQGKKKCQQFDNPDMWWALCYKKEI